MIRRSTSFIFNSLGRRRTSWSDKYQSGWGSNEGRVRPRAWWKTEGEIRQEEKEEDRRDRARKWRGRK